MREFINEHDYPPSIRDIQVGCNISSTSVVDYNLKALERLGFIRRDREVSRAIELLDRGARRPRTVAVPDHRHDRRRPADPGAVEDAWQSIDYDNVFDATRGPHARQDERLRAARCAGHR